MGIFKRRIYINFLCIFAITVNLAGQVAEKVITHLEELRRAEVKIRLESKDPVFESRREDIINMTLASV